MHLRAFIAVLAVLTVAVLVLVVATGSDGPAAEQRVTLPQEKKAVRIEGRLARRPGDEGAMIGAMREWIQAGAERLGKIDFRGGQAIPSVVSEDYEAGLRAWDDYLRQTGGKATANQAEMAGGTLFQLVEIGSTDPHVAAANAADAVRAQKIVCGLEPNLLTLSNLAIYHYFNGEYAAGDAVGKRAAQHVAKGRRASVFIQLRGYQERGEKFVARVKRGLETLRETGEKELDRPIKGYGSAAGINGYEPGTGPGSS